MTRRPLGAIAIEMTAVRQRRAARVILLDEHERVLLIRFQVARSGGESVFWATPGGGLRATRIRSPLPEES